MVRVETLANKSDDLRPPQPTKPTSQKSWLLKAVLWSSHWHPPWPIDEQTLFWKKVITQMVLVHQLCGEDIYMWNMSLCHWCQNELKYFLSGKIRFDLVSLSRLLRFVATSSVCPAVRKRKGPAIGQRSEHPEVLPVLAMGSDSWRQSHGSPTCQPVVTVDSQDAVQESATGFNCTVN